VGRVADRRGPVVPITCSLTGAVAISLLAPTLASAWALILALIVGMPCLGTLFTPAMALVSEGAQHRRLDQGLAFGLGNLAWAAGQAIAASGSGALAQATSDLVPYSLLAVACVATLGLIRIKRVLSPRHRPGTAPGSPRDRPGIARHPPGQARSRPCSPSAMERNSGSVKAVRPAYTVLIF